MRHLAATGLVLLSTLTACASSSGGSGTGGPGIGGGGGGAAGAGAMTTDFAVKACAALAKCNATVTNCVPAFSAIVWGAACQSALLSASCADLTAATPPPSLQVCFPPCASPGTASCNADGTLTECTKQGYTEILTCAGTCSANGKSYTGTCGATYNGQPSSTGSSVCWCL